MGTYFDKTLRTDFGKGRENLVHRLSSFYHHMGIDDFCIDNVEGGNLAASKIRNLECPSYEICLIDYGCGKFNRKIHIMEQYP